MLVCKLLSYTEEWERVKKESDHSRLVVAVLISKGTYLHGLSWVAIRHVDLRSHLPESYAFV